VTYTGVTRRGPREECLWMNYPEPLQLHDYRYLGKDYRERERINRKRKTWRRRLAAMPALERYAILAELEAFTLPGRHAAPGDDRGHRRAKRADRLPEPT
jgi:DNA adenine methylase